MQHESSVFAGVEETVRAFVQWLELLVEALGAAVILIGVAFAAWHFARHALQGTRGGYVRVRLVLANYLALALEFLLAADVLATAISPSWDQIGKLAAVAAIRTALNFFLQREMNEERHAEAGPSAEDPEVAEHRSV